jgi:hypothetical protein
MSTWNEIVMQIYVFDIKYNVEIMKLNPMYKIQTLAVIKYIFVFLFCYRFNLLKNTIKCFRFIDLG